MYFRVKISYVDDNAKIVRDTYLTESENFAEAGYKIIQEVGCSPDVEEIKMMRNLQPLINEKHSPDNRLYIIKIAEDIEQDNGKVKTMKYDLPVFADDSNELHTIVNNYLKQGLEDMRLTTISETKWIYI